MGFFKLPTRWLAAYAMTLQEAMQCVALFGRCDLALEWTACTKEKATR